MLFLYRAGIFLYGIALRLAALLGNPKARLLLRGRADTWARLERTLPPAAGSPLVWLHAASLGEFEMARPLIERLRRDVPTVRVVVTFFSPSGYEVRQNYPLADAVVYLPADTPRHAARLVARLQPTVAVFVKYEFWYFFLRALRQQSVPTLIVAAAFRPSQIFFRPYGGLFRQMLWNVSHLYLQNEASAKLLAQHGIPSEHYTVAGDTRADRAAEVAAAAQPYPVIETWKGAQKLLIAGSTWDDDEALLTQFWTNYAHPSTASLPPLCLLAPHETDEAHLRSIERRFAALPHPPRTERYSHFTQRTEAAALPPQILIIDNVGMLAALYRYADYAYIGGGFRTGLHNCLEAAAFGVPIWFGGKEKYKRYDEAVALVQRGAAFPLGDGSELYAHIARLEQQPAEYARAAAASRQYIASTAGATDIILRDAAFRFVPPMPANR